MTVEIRGIWVNGVEYTVSEANILFGELRRVLSLIKPIETLANPVKDFQKDAPAQDIHTHPIILPVDEHPISPPIVWRERQVADGHQPLVQEDEASKHCTTCGEDGHNKQTCTVEDNSRDYCCTMCGEPGHNRRTCPTRRIIHCSICGVEGHNKATCSVSLEDMVKEARAKLDEAEVTEAPVEVKAAVPDPDFGGDHEYDVLAAMNDPALVSNFAGWNAYMKNPANHLRFVRGKRKGQLNLKRMGQQYRLLKYGSTNKRRYSTGRGVIKRVD